MDSPDLFTPHQKHSDVELYDQQEKICPLQEKVEQKKIGDPPMIPSFANLHNMYWKYEIEPSFSKKQTVKNAARLRPLLSKHASLMDKKIKEQGKIKRQIRAETVQEKLTPPPKYKHVKPRFHQKPQTFGGKTALPVINPASNIPELEQSNVMDNYKIISHVGKGCFSVVSAAVNKNTNKKCAIKTYVRTDQMQQYRIKSIQSEVQNLFDLEHQNIISLRHAVKDGRKIQLIMENGGKQSLSGLLRKTNNFDQMRAKKYFKQMVEGIAYCHSKNICHRDLKLENILVDDQGKVKIIDFGFSLKCKPNSKFTIVCGTPPYMSPELAAGQPYNGMAADVWAIGVCLYLMLVGKFPFKASNEKELYRLIQQGKYKTGNDLSNEAKTLLASMLKTDESSRTTASAILQSDWLKIA